MRARGCGRVIMVGSMLASFPLAYRSSYGASKAAIKAFADGARFELSPFGVWVSTVEPGSVRTGIGARRTKYIADGSPYAPDFQTMLARLDHNESTGTRPEKVARTVTPGRRRSRTPSHRSSTALTATTAPTAPTAWKASSCRSTPASSRIRSAAC